jgi:hypothetical protein
MGILGLNCNVYFATTKQSIAISILRDANKPRGYPFAITGINLVHLLIKLTQNRKLDHYYFFVVDTEMEENNNESQLKEKALKYFLEAFCSLFEKFNEHWTKCNPINVLAFPSIFQEFESMVIRDNNSDL